MPGDSCGLLVPPRPGPTCMAASHPEAWIGESANSMSRQGSWAAVFIGLDIWRSGGRKCRRRARSLPSEHEPAELCGRDPVRVLGRAVLRCSRGRGCPNCCAQWALSPAAFWPCPDRRRSTTCSGAGLYSAKGWLRLVTRTGGARRKLSENRENQRTRQRHRRCRCMDLYAQRPVPLSFHGRAWSLAHGSRARS